MIISKSTIFVSDIPEYNKKKIKSMTKYYSSFLLNAFMVNCFVKKYLEKKKIKKSEIKLQEQVKVNYMLLALLQLYLPSMMSN